MWNASEVVAAAEYGAEFRTDVETFVAREIVEAAVVPGRHELPPVSTNGYVAFVDPSGGSADAFTLAIAHADGDRGVLDAVRERRPPFSPDGAPSSRLCSRATASARCTATATPASGRASASARTASSTCRPSARSRTSTATCFRYSTHVAAGAATVLRDKLLALADFSAMGRGENWVQGRLRLTPAAQARAAAPLDSRPQLPSGKTYEGRQAECIRRLMAALVVGDADGRL